MGDLSKFVPDLDVSLLKLNQNTRVMYIDENYDKGIEDTPRDDNFKPSVQTDYQDVFYLMIHTNSTYTGKVRVRYNRKGKIAVTKSV